MYSPQRPQAAVSPLSRERGAKHRRCAGGVGIKTQTKMRHYFIPTT